MTIVFVLIGFVSGILTLGLIYLFLTKRNSQKPPREFFEAKQKAIKGLELKKTALEKELTDEARKETQDLLDTLARKKDATAAQLKEEENRFNRKKQELDNQLLTAHNEITQRYNKMNEDAYAAAQAKSTQTISQLEKDTLREIEQLNSKYKEQKEEIEENFFRYRAEISSKREALTKEIQNYEARQKAIIERFKKDEQVRQEIDFFHIKIDSAAQRDICRLKELAIGFSKPEALFKLIYEVYYKSLLEELFKRVLGENKDKGGIYKITNINNQKVYIGKTVRFMERWRIHSKRGCGIERISGQLYDQ